MRCALFWLAGGVAGWCWRWVLSDHQMHLRDLEADQRYRRLYQEKVEEMRFHNEHLRALEAQRDYDPGGLRAPRYEP